jgi:regulator of RNase E activity RraA
MVMCRHSRPCHPIRTGCVLWMLCGRALLGDNIAALAVKNGWEGVIIYGAIRDSAQVSEAHAR